MIVADASVVVAALVDTGDLGRRAQEVLVSNRVQAPHLLDLEVASTLRRLARSGLITGDTGQSALAQLAQSRITRHQHRHFLQRIWELRSSVSAYDAAYVAIAERADVKLVTIDERLAAAHGPRCEIEVLSA